MRLLCPIKSTKYCLNYFLKSSESVIKNSVKIRSTASKIRTDRHKNFNRVYVTTSKVKKFISKWQLNIFIKFYLYRSIDWQHLWYLSDSYTRILNLKLFHLQGHNFLVILMVFIYVIEKYSWKRQCHNWEKLIGIHRELRT